MPDSSYNRVRGTSVVSGVECSTEIQENEKHQVTTICSAQEIINDTKFGSLTTVSWVVFVCQYAD